MWFIVWCGFKNRYQNDWTKCSNCRNHSRFSGQHNWGDLYDHLMSTRILISIMNMTFIWAHKIYEESDDTVKLDLLTISYYSRGSYPKRSGLLRRTNYLRPIYVSIIHYDPVFLHQLSIVIGLEWHFCMQYNNDICCYGQEAAWKSYMPTWIPICCPRLSLWNQSCHVWYQATSSPWPQTWPKGMHTKLQRIQVLVAKPRTLNGGPIWPIPRVIEEISKLCFCTLWCWTELIHQKVT